MGNRFDHGKEEGTGGVEKTLSTENKHNPPLALLLF